MESASIVALATAFLTVISVFLGVKYRQGHEKARLFAQLLDNIITAVEDDKVSEDEFRQIVAKTKQVAAEGE